MTAQAGINRLFLAHFSSSLFVLACIICSCHCAALQDTKQELCTSSWGIITEQKSLISQNWPARCLLWAIWVILVLWSLPESMMLGRNPWSSSIVLATVALTCLCSQHLLFNIYLACSASVWNVFWFFFLQDFPGILQTQCTLMPCNLCLLLLPGLKM